MIKVETSFTKTTPGAQKYESISFHTSMSRELSDGLSGEAIQAEIHRSYQLLEKTVEAEITQYKQKAQQPAQIPPVAPLMQAPQQVPQAPQGNPTGAISQKQISLICSLASQLKISQHELCNDALRHFGVGSYHELDKKQGSTFIDMLQQRKQPA